MFFNVFVILGERFFIYERDRHTTTAYTALAWRREAKMTIIIFRQSNINKSLFFE